jgi:hypothetical protein
MAFDPIWLLIPIAIPIVLLRLARPSAAQRAAASPYIGCDKHGRSLQAGSGGYYGVFDGGGYSCHHGDGHGSAGGGGDGGGGGGH